MLLYTRLATPKAPKRRSRAGCSFCKEKKKKCDEVRPSCARCRENDQACVYEPIKPRQRRKQDSIDEARTALGPANSSGGRPDADSTRDKAGSDGEPSDDQEAVGNDNDLDGMTWGVDGMLLDSSDHVADDLESSNRSNTGIARNIDVGAGVPFAPRTTPVNALSLRRNSASATPTMPSPLDVFGSTFAEFSPRVNRRMLVDHFSNVMSHLIVLREDDGNPFQKLVLPICHRSDAVKSAMFALASAHLEGRGVRNEEKSANFHNQAIQGLAKLIQEGDRADRNEVLAAIMLLVYYEVLVQKDRSSIVDGHLKGAMAIMSRKPTTQDPTAAFLERAFRFYDVIAALSFGTAPHSTPPQRECLAPFPPLGSSIGPAFVGVDALLGMANSLWPMIHRLSNLKELKGQLDDATSRSEYSKAAVLRTELETTASAIENTLDRWQPPISPEALLPENLAGQSREASAQGRRLQSVINSAMAYRHSAVIYLYRSIHDQPRDHAVVQHHTHISLKHCLGTVSNEGPMGALLWPLFVASCEAVTAEDRSLARESFVGIERRQGMTNIQRAWLVVQELWRRADDDEVLGPQGESDRRDDVRLNGEDLWRRVSREMGLTIVLG